MSSIRRVNGVPVDAYTDITGPLSAFGEMVTIRPNPRIQISAVEGVLTTDHETLIDASPGTGSVTVSNGNFVCQTGTGVGGYGVIRSRRVVRYRPGQAMRLRFTAVFTAGVSNSIQFAGGFSSTEAIVFAMRNTSFGILRRIAGAAAIHRLTVTAAAAGAETLTITLNGTAFTVTTGGALATTALVAQRIVAAGTFTGWSSIISPSSNGSTVTFIQANPAVTSGAFTLTSTGTVTGTFATVQAGAANDDATGFVAQTAWNVDRMDGTAGQYNPSGWTLDPTKLNVFQVLIPYLGAGAIVYQVMSDDGDWHTVHIIRYPGSAVVPTMKSPTLAIGWVAASLGSTTNLTCSGASAAAFVDGEIDAVRDPFATSVTGVTVGTTEYCFLALRNGGVFASKVNQRIMHPVDLGAASETNNRLMRVRVVLNPTFSSSLNWSYVSSTQSCVEQATPTTVTVSGGSDISHLVVASGSGIHINLQDVLLRVEHGDVVAICAATASSTSVADFSLNWNEV